LPELLRKRDGREAVPPPRDAVAALANREAANRWIVGRLVFIIFLLEVLR
jgi:hypothetical protein